MTARTKKRPPTELSVERVRKLINTAADMVGGQRYLALKCKMTQQAISRAMRIGRCSDYLAVQIHNATKGRVSVSELRPDLWSIMNKIPMRQRADGDDASSSGGPWPTGEPPERSD